MGRGAQAGGGFVKRASGSLEIQSRRLGPAPRRWGAVYAYSVVALPAHRHCDVLQLLGKQSKAKQGKAGRQGGKRRMDGPCEGEAPGSSGNRRSEVWTCARYSKKRKTGEELVSAERMRTSYTRRSTECMLRSFRDRAAAWSAYRAGLGWTGLDWTGLGEIRPREGRESGHDGASEIACTGSSASREASKKNDNLWRRASPHRV